MRRFAFLAVAISILVLATASVAYAWSPDMAFVRSGHIWVGRVDGTAGPAQLTSDPNMVDRSPAWIPGAADLIYSSEATPELPAPATWQLWRATIGPTPPVAVTGVGLEGDSDRSNGVGVSTVSGDGSTFLFDFRSITSSSMWWQTPKLYYVPSTATPSVHPSLLFPLSSSGAPADSPAWNPSRPFIAASREDNGDDFNNIWLISTDTGAVLMKITSASLPHQRWERPAWSPSGEWLTATYNDGATYHDGHTGDRGYLYSMRWDGSSRTRMTDPGAGKYDQASAWSKDGNTVVFERYDNVAGTSDLYSIPSNATPAVAPTLLMNNGAEPSAVRDTVSIVPVMHSSASVVQYAPALSGGVATVWASLPGGPPASPLLVEAGKQGVGWAARLTTADTHLRYRITGRKDFYAMWGGPPSSISAPIHVSTRPWLFTSWSARRIALGGRLQVGVILKPRMSSKAVLQRKLSGTWRTIRTARLFRSGVSNIGVCSYTPTRRGAQVLRVVIPATGGWASAATGAHALVVR
jgi:hypothetical protein